MTAAPNNNLVALWNSGLSQLSTEIDPQVFAAYIRPLKICGFDEKESVLIEAPSRLIGNHVEHQYKQRLAELMATGLGRPGLQVRLLIKADGPSSSASVSSSGLPGPVIIKKIIKPPPQFRQQSLHESFLTGLSPHYTFTNFVVGASNQFVHAGSVRVSEQPGQVYNPLFIYGGVGLGKTHLMHAIGNAVLQRQSSAKILYISSESFTNEVITAIRLGKMDAFKKRMRNVSILLVDDIQFLSGKDRTQEEFFHTFNSLYSDKKQIVITSDKMPQDIKGLEERLRTRFAWGLTADLQSPDFETRVAILRRKAALSGLDLSAEVASYVAERICSNVRELEGALTRLGAASSLQNCPISLDLATSALRPLISKRPAEISISDIRQVVADRFGLKVADLISKRRTRNIALPRHIAMYLCRKHTTASYPEIGQQFGGRDHSSVIHAANVVAQKVNENTDVVELIKELERKLLEP